MAKEYSIKKEYLLKLKDMLAAMGTDKADIDYSRVQYVLERINSDFTFNEDTQDTIVDTLAFDMNDAPFYRRYYPKVKKFHRDGAVVWSKPKDIEFQPVKITHDDALGLTRGFFAHQGEFFLKGFDKVMRDPEDHISFIDTDSQTAGEMQYLATLDEAFMFIPDHKSIELLTTLVHETQHCIDNSVNNDFFYQTGINEATTLFMELLATDYFNDILHLDNQNLVAQYDLFTSIKMQTNRLMDRNRMLMLYKKIAKYDRDFIYRRLTKKWTPEYLERTKDTSLVTWNFYQVSYLIAVELYKLYKKDKKAALDIVKAIMMEGNDNNIFTLLHNKGIVLNKNMFEYEKKLIYKYDNYREQRGD